VDAVQRFFLHSGLFLQAALDKLRVAEILVDAIIALTLIVSAEGHIRFLTGQFFRQRSLLTRGEVVVDNVGAKSALKGRLQAAGSVQGRLQVVEAAEHMLTGDAQLGRLCLASLLQSQQVRVLLHRRLAGTITHLRLLIEIPDALQSRATVNEPVGRDAVVVTHDLDLVHKVLSQDLVLLPAFKLQISPEQDLHALPLCLSLKGQQTVGLGVESVTDALPERRLSSREGRAQKDILHNAAQNAGLDNSRVDSRTQVGLTGAGSNISNTHLVFPPCSHVASMIGC
jgi:hypothetical protein